MEIMKKKMECIIMGCYRGHMRLRFSGLELRVQGAGFYDFRG